MFQTKSFFDAFAPREEMCFRVGQLRLCVREFLFQAINTVLYCIDTVLIIDSFKLEDDMACIYYVADTTIE